MDQSLAQFIGFHAISFILLLLLFALLVIVLLWRLFEAYYARLWAVITRTWERIVQRPVIVAIKQRYPALWSFLSARLSPDGYLGLHLTLGLLLSLVAMFLFASLADAVVDQETLVQFDQSLAVALHQNAIMGYVAAFRVITELGNTPVLAGLGLVVGVVLLVRRNWLLLTSWVITLVGGGLLNLALKAIFQRARPEFMNPFVVESYWSFPSGHAMSSFVAYGMLAYLLILVVQGLWKQVVIVAAVLIVLLIGFSRLYLGVHFFSDVVGGYAAAAVWLAFAISGTEIARRRQKGRLSQPPEESRPGPASMERPVFRHKSEEVRK